MRRLAIRCVLSAKAGDGKIKILENMKIDEPKTKDMVKILDSLGVGNSVLIATTNPERNVIKSARNLAGIRVSPADLLSVLDLLSYNVLLITETAVRRIEQLWGGSCLKEGSNESLRGIAPPSNN
jgi:large subunit ribosomal protein L4